ncbi:MAG: helix-turn-helix transcriptional regulator [Bacteroidales bacterium]
MNSRLQQFLELENLTPARLADIIGVQRSGLSHILSGRNKPGYEFINRLLIKFPAISADWLLTGKGKPYKEMGNLPSPTLDKFSSLNSESKTNNLTNQQYNNQQYNSQQLVNQPILDKTEVIADLGTDFSANTLFSSISENSTLNEKATVSTYNQNISDINRVSQLNENQTNTSKQESVRKKRNVKRVIIFYSDGSFEELFPQSL